MTPKAWLFLAMGLFVTYYAVTWVRNVKPEDGSAEATGNPPPLALIINALIGAFFGWVSGGGLQYTDGRFVATSPFGPNGTDVSMLIAIVTMTILGAAVAFLMHRGKTGWPKPIELAIGFSTNFFDTLGIGSFAPTTAVFKSTKIVDDRLIPGTLNVGHTPPTIAEAFIFIAIVAVDFKTLVVLLLASVLGARLGAGVVAGWSKRNLTRRTRISIETWDRGVSAAIPTASLMAPVLGWSDEQQRKEIEHYLARVEAERASQQQPDDETADSARMGAPEIVPLA